MCFLFAFIVFNWAKMRRRRRNVRLLRRAQDCFLLLISFWLVQIDWRSDNLLRLIIDSLTAFMCVYVWVCVELLSEQRGGGQSQLICRHNHLHGAIVGQHFSPQNSINYQLHFIDYQRNFQCCSWHITTTSLNKYRQTTEQDLKKK